MALSPLATWALVALQAAQAQQPAVDVRALVEAAVRRRLFAPKAEG